MGFEADAQFGKVNRALALVDLHRISSTKRDMRTAFTREMNKVSRGAGAAIGAGTCCCQLCVLVRPDIPREKSAPHFGAGADEKFQRFGRCDGRDQIYGGS